MHNPSNIPQATSSLEMWLSYLTDLHSQAIDMGLERVGEVARKMGLVNFNQSTPTGQGKTKVITVTGTNGKGTTCHTLESILLAAGLKVGVYSSPHLVRYTERVRIQGQEPTESAFCQAFAEIETQRADISLTYFEYGTLAALKLFKDAQLDVLILEVGLGGRLDATNVVDSDITAITSIALDHTDWLGSDREHIGYEKAGIFRAGCYAVIGEPDMPKSIQQVADQLGTQLFRRDKEWCFTQNADSWSWQTAERQYAHLPLPNVPLANAATALGVLHCIMKIDPEWQQLLTEDIIHNGLRSAQLPGRFQIINRQPLTILDVAHNPHAAGYLVAKLAELPKISGCRIRAVIGMLGDKDIAGTLQCLATQVTDFYVAPLTEFRGAEAAVLAQYLPEAQVFDSVESAWKQAQIDAKQHDIIVVCGSFHTVAHVMTLLEK
ncbi:bifunctional tetrahydrofolate synthase/dihydrofolate synthase [Moellerella wisconsensis]|uniref:Dihydrofolate synthase/folylpolyglutamate synthase n=1 Tax=Moellerella wisconsensis ATCC 35017 TaxID=1354267 RepID=A0A0N0IAK0_9GAMM|nr:bifunctional tetrahydrofolate synthase/dihydrofolate synthase [Moellerella wisconsensis]KPD03103.1 dihydrofolate synthase/folylpolyglutamate synthase [Moellerella wisconsensis ATCC 35017]VFS48429.1 Bifunctional protein folC [Moellerella wisconsensis]